MFEWWDGRFGYFIVALLMHFRALQDIDGRTQWRNRSFIRTPSFLRWAAWNFVDRRYVYQIMPSEEAFPLIECLVVGGVQKLCNEIHNGGGARFTLLLKSLKGLQKFRGSDRAYDDHHQVWCNHVVA